VTVAARDLNGLALPALWATLAATGLPRRLFELARDEDLGPTPGVDASGDVTSLASPLSGARSSAALRARGALTASGLAVVPTLLGVFDPGGAVAFEARCDDGARAAPGDVLGVLSGDLRAMLAVERPVLNIVSRLSGIATLTSRYAERLAAGGPGEPTASLYDTRKTTPGLRVFEKYAVRCGGGRCHRFGLSDAVLLKDNHIAGVPDGELAAFVRTASDRARADRAVRFVQVEVDRLEQLDALLTLPAGVVDIVLLDNMDAATLREAAARRDAHNPAVQLESSGGVTLETIAELGRTGVERISVGALTHQAVSVDIGLDIEG
jgi:nicotinate-nucleotide pyrophosphorylase (carboxylating)